MKECFKTRNFSYMLGLIEEARTLGGRMEAALDYNHYHQKRKEEQAELDRLRIETDALRVKKGEKPKGPEKNYF